VIDSVFVVLVTGSFVAAVFGAAFSAGGALIILAITSTVLPVQAIVPIHSTLLIGSTAARTAMFWEYVDWKIVWPFLVGSLVGALLGARIYIELPEAIIATSISILMIIAIWLPSISWRPKLKHPWAIVGFLHTLISTLFAYGALFHSVILHTSLRRQQIVGTMAGALVGMSVLKIAGYVWFGFDYSPYFAIIAAAVVANIVGTAVGRRLGEFLPENAFRLAFRVLVTVTAVRLLYAGLV